MNNCPICGRVIQKPAIKYCSNKCESTDKYYKYIEDWKNGLETGTRGIHTKNVSAHIKRYLFDKFGSKCILCGWNKVHPNTHKVPLEIDHINGNAEDNREENLRLLCPNCHSLSQNYRNLNKGMGRKWRSERYIKNLFS